MAASGSDFAGADTILVTGAGGVLGTALLAELAAAGCSDVVGLRRADCDLLDASATADYFQKVRPRIVFHLAGWVAGVQGNLSNAGQAFYENARINLNVAEAARRSGVSKIVAAGTAAIYSNDIPLPMREDHVWTGPPHASEAAYGHAKRALLAQLEAYRLQYGIDFAYMICTNLYGEGDRFDEKFGHVVPSLISRFERAGREQEPSITIWGDGSPTRDFLYARDAARAFIMAGSRAGTHGALNLATGSSVTIRELVSTLAAVVEYRGEILWDTTRPNGQNRRAYDVSRLRQLGWEPRTSLREGLERSVAWYRQNRPSVRR